VEDAGFDHSPAAAMGGLETAGAPAHGVRPLARFYMTSDLRAATGLTRTHLDYYLREGLIVPTARTESGYLLFDDDEVARVRQIIAARQAGESLREIKTRLRRGPEGGQR
jgi:MerR family transcriptional regulator, Zn(II)-responsive regulator of zntA